MRKFVFLLIAFLLATSAYAITGISVGAKAGTTFKTDLGSVDGLADIDNMSLLGAQLKMTTLPFFDVIGTIEYTWTEKELVGLPGILKVHDLGLTLSVVYPFKTPVVKPYAGLGIGTHSVHYTAEMTGAATPVPLPNNTDHLGYHVLGGVDLGLPALPISFTAEARVTWIETEGELTRYSQITGGVSFGL